MKQRTLWFFTALLLVQLLIRAHNITALPVFTDEQKHIDRAAKLHHLEEHPAKDGRGKFLFYFIPGVFDLKDDDTALHLARTSVALTSLLTTALIFLICRTLFDRRVGMLAAAFYVFAPYAFFFERMALADAFAGLIGTATVWCALRFAQRPQMSTAFWLGVFMAFTPASKLTMSFVAMIPAATILILGRYGSLRDLWQRWAKWSLVALLVTAALWSLVLIPARISTVRGEDYILFEQHLVGAAESITFSAKLGEWWEKMVLLLTLPITLLWFAGIAGALAKFPRRTTVLLIWLALAWFATFFIVVDGSFQSRYLMAGMPAVASLFGVGIITLLDSLFQWLGQPELPRRRLSAIIATIIMGGWVLLFALPFARAAATEPARLHLPPQDEKDYLAGWFNGYGLVQALEYLGQHGQPGQNGEITTLLHTRFCMPDYYDFGAVRDYTCFGNLHRHTPTTRAWRTYVEASLAQDGVLYVVTDNYKTLPDFPTVQETLLYTYKKPYSGQPIEVWEWKPAPE